MKKFHLRTVKYIKAQIIRLDTLVENSDLPELHRMSVDIQTSLPENIVHENRPLFLQALRTTKEKDIAEYAEKLREKLVLLHDEYLAKANR